VRVDVDAARQCVKMRYNARMVRRVIRAIGLACCLSLLGATDVAGVERVVASTAQFSTALAAAGPGDQIILQPGVYGGGHYRANLAQVTIRSADPANPAIIDGGSNGIQLSDSSNVTISDLVFRNQVDNGLNIDDGGTFDTPAVNLTLRNITVRDIVSAGNHDGIKLSGVNDFLIENVQVLNWGVGGSAVDMVGCHRGLIQNSNFTHTNSANAGTTLQPKGGSKDITFRANRIELPRGSGRAVQAGGSTGTPFFRFVDGDSGYEANQIVAEGNVIIGGSSAFSWVNIDGGVFHHNVVSRPGQWVARILNENGGLPIVDTQNGVLQDNRIVYNDTSTEFSTAVNVGPETLPNTFSFARNEWLNLANQTAAGSTPSLPVAETGGVYGAPAASIDGPQVWNFAWGKWIVNANATQQTVDVSALQSLRQALAGSGAKFDPLDADPLGGVWTTTSLPAASLLMPAFSQAILIDPAACPECVSIAGDYDANGRVELQDYNVWRSNFGTAIAASDGNYDGIVDAADYVVWRDALGSSATASLNAGESLAVAEPAAFVLSICGLSWFLLHRQREHHARRSIECGVHSAN
jgi:hypothetical protein